MKPKLAQVVRQVNLDVDQIMQMLDVELSRAKVPAATKAGLERIRRIAQTIRIYTNEGMYGN